MGKPENPRGDHPPDGTQDRQPARSREVGRVLSDEPCSQCGKSIQTVAYAATTYTHGRLTLAYPATIYSDFMDLQGRCWTCSAAARGQGKSHTRARAPQGLHTPDIGRADRHP